MNRTFTIGGLPLTYKPTPSTTDLPYRTNLACWLAGNKIVGQANNTLLATWLDSSGNVNNAVQATGADQPTYLTNFLNGLPVVRFDNVAGVGMQTPLALADDSAFTIFLVSACLTLDAGYHRVLTGQNNWLWGYRPSVENYNYYMGDFIVGDAVSTDWTYTTLINTPATQSEMRMNGASKGTNAATGGPGLHLCVGNSAWYSGEAPDAYIAEMIAYTATLTSGNILSVEGYLKAKYGL